MSLNWYGVKTLYRTTAQGEPESVDRYYDPEATMVEERVVLFRASSFDEASDEAAKEARAYAKGKRLNRYGQRLQKRFLGVTDAFELFDAPGPGAEVFSATLVVPTSVSDSEFQRSRMGQEKAREKWRRTKFLQRELVAPLGKRAL